jgi:hypothetical protein
MTSTTPKNKCLSSRKKIQFRKKQQQKMPRRSTNNNTSSRNSQQGAVVNAELLALSRARTALRADATRVSDTLKELVTSDERFLDHSKKSEGEYDAKLNAASKRLEAIAKRERLDNQILWWSFTIFFVVVAWIWKQRLIGISFW